MLAFVENGTCKPWRGERLKGIAYPANIEALWTDEELKAIGLFRVQRFAVPAGKKVAGPASYAVVGDVAIEAYAVVDFTANERIAAIEAARHISQRALREFIETIANGSDPKATEAYKHAAETETLIAPLRAAAKAEAAIVPLRGE